MLVLKSGRLQEYPRVIHCGGATGQAETIPEEVGLALVVVRGYLTKHALTSSGYLI